MLSISLTQHHDCSGNGSEFADFDYSKISAVGNDLGGPGSQTVWGHALCTAHAHGVRALPNIAAVGLWPPTVANSGLDHSACMACWWANESAISAWVTNAVPSLQSQGYDGAFLDLEEPMPNASVVRGMRSLVCQLKLALNQSVPGSKVMWSMELLPSGGAGPGEIVESHCLDTILLMGYGAAPAIPPWNESLPICKAHPDKCAHLGTHGVEKWNPEGNPYNDPALAAGQSSLDSYRIGIASWLALGARPSELAIMTPWFAKHFSCAGVPSPDGSAPCRLNVHSGWTGPTGGEVGYGAALQYCNQSQYDSHWSDDWDSAFCDVPGTAVASVFDLPQLGKQGTAQGSWQRCPWAIEGQNTSWWHRVYYEDPKSLALKYALATSPAAAGEESIGGFGMWCASAAITAMGPAVAVDMWKAVPAMSRAEALAEKTDDVAEEVSSNPVTRPAVSVGRGGEANISLGNLHVQLHSTFATFLGTAQFAQLSNPSVVVASATGGTNWEVRWPSQEFSITRTIVAEQHRILFRDAVSVSPNCSEPVLGFDIAHSASLGLPVSDIVNATVPGAYTPFSCTSLNEDQPFVDPKGGIELLRLHRGTFGNPSVHVQTLRGGVGLLPLDDVSEIQGYANQTAFAQLPRAPGTCPVTSPPRIGLHNRAFALAAGDSYVLEFALYIAPPPSSYWNFINILRSDIGSDAIPIPATGYLGMYPRTDNEPFLQNANYTKAWEDMSLDELRELFRDQSMQYVHGSIPQAKQNSTCGGPLLCHGSCFVNELPSTSRSSLLTLVERTKQADPARSLLMYTHSFISSESDAATKYADSWITSYEGDHISYVHCAEGAEYPMFFGTETNSYGLQLMAYYKKVLSMGFSGVYHDEWCATGTQWTFSTWDRRSAVLHPLTKRVMRRIGSLCLLTQQHEMKMASLVLDSGGEMVLNGQPTTRSWRQFAQAAVARGHAITHVVEDPFESWMMHTHLHTPIALLRYGGDSHDPDPRYNHTCLNISDLTGCIGQNVAAHLDFGAASYLYDGLWPKGSKNVMQYSFPLLAPITIGPGLIEASNRIVTRHSGDVSPPLATPTTPLDVWSFDQRGLLLEHSSGVGVAHLKLNMGQIGVVAIQAAKTDDGVQAERLRRDHAHDAIASNSSIRDGKLLVDGQPYFIWGSYTQDLQEVDWDYLRSSGYNTVLSYTNGNASAFVINVADPAQSDFHPIRRFMDAAAAHQMKVILNLKDMYNLTRDMSRVHCDDQCTIALITALVAEFKSHTALLGYYLSDETPTNLIPMITKRQNLVASLDPHHITYFVEEYYTSEGATAFRQGMASGTSAVFGVDVYPWDGPAGTFGNSSVSSSPVSIGHEGVEQQATSLAFRGEPKVGLCSAMQTFDMRALFCGKCQRDDETKWCYRCNATFPPLEVLRAMAFIQPVASRSVGVIQYSYSSAFDSYNETSQTYGPLLRSNPIMRQRLEELRRIGLQFRDFIENEFLWEWTGLATNGTKLGTDPTVFAASFELAHRGLETIVVVNAISTRQPVAVNLKNGSRLCVLLEPWQVWINKADQPTLGRAEALVMTDDVPPPPSARVLMSRAEALAAKHDDEAADRGEAARLRAELAAAQAQVRELTAQLELQHAPTPPPPPPPPDARVLMNPLKGLRPLQKVHYSWPFGWDLQHGLNPDPSYADGVFHDYTRIAGALPYGLSDLETSSLNATVRICEAVKASRVADGLPPPVPTPPNISLDPVTFAIHRGYLAEQVVAINYSPWYEKFKSSDPNDDGPQEKAELTYLESLLAHLTRDMEALNTEIEVGAVLFDSEKFAATPANRAAVIRKHDLIFNLTRKYLPFARIELYGRGTMTRADNWHSYCAPPQSSCSIPASPWWMRTSYTLEERGESLAISVYTVPEIWEMRAIMTETVALARKHNASGQLSGGVTPWISLGAGYRRVPNNTLDGSYEYTMIWDFDRVYSWQLGAEMNIPWWGSPERESMTAPWGVAQVVVLYPSVFNPDSAQAGPGNRSIIAMQHFVNCALHTPQRGSCELTRRVCWQMYAGRMAWRGPCRKQTTPRRATAVSSHSAPCC